MNSTEKGGFGEKAVNELSFHTYLKYWCYPNPKDERGSKKEICDLLILFKANAIIISVKNYSFKGDYERYFRSTLDKAISQVQGAERKLFSNNTDLYIKHPDLLEHKFEPGNYRNIYRLIINLNTTPLFYPAGRKSKNGYVHIFNWNAFLRIVRELDTIPDFINYIKVREELFENKESLFLLGAEEDWDKYTGQEYFKYMNNTDKNEERFISIMGDELDLLANYYFNERKFNQHFYSTEYTHLNIDLAGKWDNYLNRKEVQRKKDDERLSYFIDEFVKREVLYKSDADNLEIASELLSLSRYERRIVGKQFFEFAEKYKDRSGLFSARRYGKVGDLTIGFLLHGKIIEDEKVLTFMNLAISGYCYFDNYRTKKIILIATSNELDRLKFGYAKNVEPFSPDLEEDIKHDLKALNWFQHMEVLKFNVEEYPDQ